MTHALLTIKKVTLYLMSNVIPVVLALLSGILFFSCQDPISVACWIFLGYVTTTSSILYLFSQLIRKLMMLKASYE